MVEDLRWKIFNRGCSSSRKSFLLSMWEGTGASRLPWSLDISWMKSLHIRNYTKALSKGGGTRTLEECSLSGPRLPSNAPPCYSSRSPINILLPLTPLKGQRLGCNGYLDHTQGQMQPATFPDPTQLKQEPNTVQPKLICTLHCDVCCTCKPQDCSSLITYYQRGT